MTNKKCPKCGSQNFRIEEECTTTLIYEVYEGTVEAQGECNDASEHVKTTCICDECSHRWHPRKFDFIVDK